MSWEDPKLLYARRLLARRTKISATRLREYRVDAADEHEIMVAAQNAERDPFFLVANGKAVERVASDIRALCESEGIGVVIVDYLQAIPCEKRIQDRRNEITYIARTLTDVIKNCNAAGLMFSQIKRQPKKGEKPTMHDLKESGDIENAAENVFMGYQREDGTPAIVCEKAKDGMKGREYELVWDSKACCFVGEAAAHEYDDGRFGQ